MLALEAECQRNPANAEAWRLLGTVQAENDDDQQAIAAMNRCAGAGEGGGTYGFDVSNNLFCFFMDSPVWEPAPFSASQRLAG